MPSSPPRGQLGQDVAQALQGCVEGMPSLRTDPPPPGTHLLGDRPTVLLRLQTPGAGLGAAHRGLPWQLTHVRAGTLTLDQHMPEPPSCALTEHGRSFATAHTEYAPPRYRPQTPADDNSGTYRPAHRDPDPSPHCLPWRRDDTSQRHCAALAWSRALPPPHMT